MTLIHDFNSAPQVYDLFAVVIHSGTPYSGHYHAYIRDTLQEGNWRVPFGGNDVIDTPQAPV